MLQTTISRHNRPHDPAPNLDVLIMALGEEAGRLLVERFNMDIVVSCEEQDAQDYLYGALQRHASRAETLLLATAEVPATGLQAATVQLRALAAMASDLLDCRYNPTLSPPHYTHRSNRLTNPAFAKRPAYQS